MKHKDLKQLFFVVITLTASITNASAQDDITIDQTNYIGYYLYIYQEDSSSIYRVKSDEMALYIGSLYSKFEHSGAFYKDSLMRHYSQHDNQDVAFNIIWSKTSNISTGGHFTKYKVIKSNNDNTVTIAEKMVRGPKLQVSEPLELTWNIMANSDTIISNYKCKKATTFYGDRHYEAWYTIEIPISDGPYKFKGLPGLIVKLQDSQLHHIFELNQFLKVNNNRPIFFNKDQYQKVTMKDYYKAKNAELMNLVRAFNGEGDVKIETRANTGEITAKLLSNNNYIERL